MNGLTALFKVLTPGRIIALVLSLAIVAAVFIVLSNRLQTASMGLLYGGLTATESAEIAAQLDTLGVPYQIKGDSAIYVPSSRVGELRLNIAGAGLVGANNTGYEIFDNASSFGTTALVQNLNAKRALEGELARTITSLPAVQSARVHLVLPKRQVFSRQVINPSAGVSLNLGGRVLTEEQVGSIAQLVAAAVPNLTAAQVTVIDQRGNLLSTGKGSEGRALTFQQRLKRQVEVNYETDITKMLEKVVGPGKVAVQVTADLDFDRIEESTETYDPEQQVVRSEQRSENNISAQRNNAGGGVGVAGNLPDGAGGGNGTGSQETELSTEETINYEIGKTVKHVVREGGATKRLSVAVLVEGGRNNTDLDGSYTPMTDTEKAKLETLVKTAMGYNEARGDTVEVTDMAFSEIPEPPAVDVPMFTKADYMKFGEYGALLLILLVTVFFVLRPVLNAFKNISLDDATSGAIAAATGGAGMVAPAGGGGAAGGGGGAGGPGPGSIAEDDSETTIDISQVKGRVKESKVKQVGEIVDAYPEESLSVVRNWMASDTANK